MNALSSTPPLTSWPESAPQEGEDHVVSVICGNSHLHWAFHNGFLDEFTPSLFWRTPQLKASDINGTITDVLSRHLPRNIHNFVFGEGIKASSAAAQKAQADVKRPPLTVYIISTVEEQTRYLHALWSTVPSRVFLMQGDDFYTIEQGRYESMGVDRLSALRGAADIQGYPALVFDGGTATTCTAADSDGLIIGGTIGPGLHIKLKSLCDYTDALPKIQPTEVLAKVKSALSDKQPISSFAKNTTEAIIVDALLEFSLKSRALISHWIKIVGKANDHPSSSDKKHEINNERAVFVTGGDGELLAHLLDNKSRIISELNETATDLFNSEACNIRHQKHLVHYGLSAVVITKYRERAVESEKNMNFLAEEEETKENQTLLRSRVAKMLDSGDVYRGSVVGIEHNPVTKVKLFQIRYDEGDRENVDDTELKAMRALYEKDGEKAPKNGTLENTYSRENDYLKKQDAPGDDALGTPQSRQPILQKRKASISVSKLKNKVAKISSSSKKNTPPFYFKKRVAKYFENDLFFGTVVSYDTNEKLWKVVYDDDDREEYDIKELEEVLELYSKQKTYDPKYIKKKKKYDKKLSSDGPDTTSPTYLSGSTPNKSKISGEMEEVASHYDPKVTPNTTFPSKNQNNETPKITATSTIANIDALDI